MDMERKRGRIPYKTEIPRRHMRNQQYTTVNWLPELNHIPYEVFSVPASYEVCPLFCISKVFGDFRKKEVPNLVASPLSFISLVCHVHLLTFTFTIYGIVIYLWIIWHF